MIKNKKNPRAHQELLYTPIIPLNRGIKQEDKYNNHRTTPEEVISTFKETARLPVCTNLKSFCEQWENKKEQIEKIEQIMVRLPYKKQAISLRGIYGVMLPRLQKELRTIERHIRQLQHCLELLEKRNIFTKPATFTDHVNRKSLKERLDISDIIGQSVRLHQYGKTLKGCCPFHNDHSPSFVVYLKDQRWWCFSCNEGGDIFSFLQKLHNCNFREAVNKLQHV
ncbi:MAG: CHC2 zinc finger domain-containing protein [Thermodesulfobacteriota bacterium]